MRWPHLQGGAGEPTVKVWGTCPKCSGKITYGFSGKTAAAVAVPAALVCWWAYPLLGESVVLIFPIIILLPAMSLEKWS